MIRYVLFDLDDTLLDFKAGEAIAFSSALEKFGITPNEQMVERYHEINSMLWKRLELQEIGREELMSRRFGMLFQEFSIDLDGIEVEKCYEHELSLQHIFMPGALSILEELYGSYELYMVSNGSTDIQNRRLDDSGLRRYFRSIFISQELGAEKPSARFFDIVFSEITGFRRDQAIIVGDSLSSDIRGGKNAGILTCHFASRGAVSYDEVVPDHVIYSLSELSALLKRL